jgi:hypothetical protein
LRVMKGACACAPAMLKNKKRRSGRQRDAGLPCRNSRNNFIDKVLLFKVNGREYGF